MHGKCTRKLPDHTPYGQASLAIWLDGGFCSDVAKSAKKYGRFRVRVTLFIPPSRKQRMDFPLSCEQIVGIFCLAGFLVVFWTFDQVLQGWRSAAPVVPAKVARDPPARLARALREVRDEDNPDSGLSVFRSVDAMELGEPYRTTIRQVVDGTLCRAFNAVNVIVIPLVGWTSAGKSSLLKGLQGIPLDDFRIVVRSTMHTPVVPIVALWKILEDGTRVILMDLPGIDEGNAAGRRHWEKEDIVATLEMLVKQCGVHAAMLVVGDQPLAPVRKMFVDAWRLLGNRLFVVQNARDKGLTDGEVEASVQQLEEQFQLDGEAAALDMGGLTVVRVRAVGEGVAGESFEDLAALLLQWCNESKEAVWAARDQQEEDKIYADLLKESEGTSWGVGGVVGAATAFATWLPGVAGWGYLGGAALGTLPVVGTVLLVPAAVTVVSVGGAYALAEGVRHMTAREEAQAIMAKKLAEQG